MQKHLPKIKQDLKGSLGSGRRQLVEKESMQSSQTKVMNRRAENNSIAKYHRRSLDLTEKRKPKYESDTIRTSRSPSVVSNDSNGVLGKYLAMYDETSINLPRIKKNLSVNESPSKTQDTQTTLRKTSGSARRNFIIRKQNIRKVDYSHRDKTKLKKFRKCANVVLFILRVKARVKANYIRYSKTLKLSQKLLRMIDKQVNKYYVQVLREPLLTYEEILSKKLKQKKYEPEIDIVNNLVEFSQKLAKSSLRRDILDFLTLISMSHAFVPVDYFCEFELIRLNFHPCRQQIDRVSNEQLKMIVGFFMGIKLLYTYVFLQPANIRLFELNIEENEKKLKPVLRNYCSVIYWCILEMFQKVKSKDHKFLEKLIEKGWEPMIIEEESPAFYEDIKKHYKKKYQQITKNIHQWIEKISMAVIRNRQLFIH